jgi:hypothetical protein
VVGGEEAEGWSLGEPAARILRAAAAPPRSALVAVVAIAIVVAVAAAQPSPSLLFSELELLESTEGGDCYVLSLL